MPATKKEDGSVNGKEKGQSKTKWRNIEPSSSL